MNLNLNFDLQYEKHKYLFDYVERNGKKTFKEYEFNVVDALIFSILSYYRFDFMLDEVNSKLRLQEASDIYFYNADLVALSSSNKYRNKFLKLLAKAKRYQDLILFNYSNDLDEKEDKQFGAIAIEIDKKRLFISFRGTDSSFIGIKEDLNMTYKDTISSQEEALIYRKKFKFAKYKEVFIGGHSKGGNIAVYFALNSDKRLFNKIKYVFNFDGPGFIDLEESKLGDKLITIVPETSIVGMILNKPKDVIMVKSSAFGMHQHNPFSWELVDDKFSLSRYVSRTSRFFNNSTLKYLLDLDEKERETFIEIIWELIGSTEATTVVDLKKDVLSRTAKVISAYKLLSKENKDLIKKHFKTMINLMFKSLKALDFKSELQTTTEADIDYLYKL